MSIYEVVGLIERPPLLESHGVEDNSIILLVGPNGEQAVISTPDAGVLPNVVNKGQLAGVNLPEGFWGRW